MKNDNPVEIFKELIQKDSRKWTKDLFELVEKRYQDTLPFIKTKSIVIDTENDFLLLNLFVKAYHRIASLFPAENPFMQNFSFDEDSAKWEDDIGVDLILKTAKEVIEDIFLWADVIVGKAELSEDLKTLLKNWDKTKYPRSLFIRANQIYNLQRKPGTGNHTLDTALEKALSEFDGFKKIKQKSFEFLKIKNAYKKFRAPNKKKKKK